MLFLRGYRCTPECGWRGVRFSRSRFRRQRKRFRVAVVGLVFMLMAAVAVRYVLARMAPPSKPSDDGVREVDL
jgi:hypothetical protein